MRAIVLFFWAGQIFLTLLFSSNVLAKEASGDSQKIQILTTIKPITILVYAIAKDKADIEQLIPDFASVHDYSFKPSDLKKVSNATIVFRIDEHLEALLNPVFKLLPNSTPLISLAEDENILLLPASNKDNNKKVHAHEHEHGNTDLHIWTSPQNAIIMAKNITKVLSEVDLKNASIYQKNLSSLISNINKTAEKISDELIKVKNKKYIVFHNSWQYFQKSFGLQKPFIMSLNESITPRIKSIRKARKSIQKLKPSCVFSGPHIADSRVKTLIEGFSLNTATIDALASDTPIDEDAYTNWLKSMNQQILTCLQNM